MTPSSTLSSQAFETTFHQQRHIATVVKVGMGKDDCVDVNCRNGHRVPVAQAQLFVALEQTAVHQQTFATVFYAVFRTCDGAGTA